jgi:hypothetical protein
MMGTHFDREYRVIIIFCYLSDKIHKSCKLLNTAHICTLDRSSLKSVQSPIKSRRGKALLAPKTVLAEAAKAAREAKAPAARGKASAPNVSFAPMEFLAKASAGPDHYRIA